MGGIISDPLVFITMSIMDYNTKVGKRWLRKSG